MTNSHQTKEPVDLFDSDFHQDPYTHLGKVRESLGYFRSETWRGVMLLRYDDIEAALRCKQLSLGDGVAALFDGLDEAQKEELSVLRKHVGLWLGTLPKEQHGKLRKQFNKAFSRSIIDNLRPEIQKITDQLLDEFYASPSIDFLEELASPLPALTIAMILGTPIEDREKFQKWSTDLTAFLGFGLHDIKVMRQAQSSVIEMTEYLRQLIRNVDKPSGLLAHLLQCLEDGTMEEESLLANCALLLFAGYETTTMLISNGLYALLSNPDQLAKLKSDPSLMSNAIDEFLRLEAPVMMVRRVALEDVSIGEIEIKQGEFVWLLLGSGNHDGSKHDRAAQLDITRKSPNHLSFGAGMHFCLGAMLSKIEAEVAINSVLTRFPNVRLGTKQPYWAANPTARMLQQFEIDVSAIEPVEQRIRA